MHRVIMQIEGHGAFRVPASYVATMGLEQGCSLGDVYVVDPRGNTWAPGGDQWLLWESTVLPLGLLTCGEDHDDSFDEWCDGAAQFMTGLQRAEWGLWCLKATPSEIVQEACRILGVPL